MRHNRSELAKESGYFREQGTAHLHIDGGGDADFLLKLNEIVSSLKSMGFPGKFNEVLDSVKGPQIEEDDHEQTYINHSPGGPDSKFGVFSTTSFGKCKELSEDQQAPHGPASCQRTPSQDGAPLARQCRGPAHFFALQHLFL